MLFKASQKKTRKFYKNIFINFLDTNKYKNCHQLINLQKRIKILLFLGFSKKCFFYRSYDANMDK